MDKADERTVWSRVKEALNDAGLLSTQIAAAKLIGVEQGSVSDWNKPNRYPTIENAVAIAEKTNTCVEWILTGRGPKHPGPPEERKAAELWSLWQRIPEDRQGELLGHAREWAVKKLRARAMEDSEEIQRRTS